jgi:hypothetical protein
VAHTKKISGPPIVSIIIINRIFWKFDILIINQLDYKYSLCPKENVLVDKKLYKLEINWVLVGSTSKLWLPFDFPN